MTPSTTFVAVAVRALRGHGGRPATDVAGGPSWADVAADARALALGLRAVGVAAGSVVHVRPTVDGPAAQVAREVAVLATGSALALPAHGSCDDEVATLGDEGLDHPRVHASLASLLAPERGGGGPPDDHEEVVAGIGPHDPAVVADGRVVTHGELLWAFRSVERWLLPVVGPWGPGRVVAVADGAPIAPVATALVGRWWPALAGAQLVTGAATATQSALVRRADLVVGDPGSWSALARTGRDRADRSRRGRALLRHGRVAAADEPRSRGERAAGRVLARRTAPDVRDAAGLGRMALGICLGPLAVADARDLAALGVPAVPTWVDPRLPAPVAAGPVVHPTPAGRWGRPLPGRSVACGGPVTTVAGGDVPGGEVVLPVRTEADGRDRVALR